LYFLRTTRLCCEGQLDWSKFAVKVAEASQGEGPALVRRLQTQLAAGGGGGSGGGGGGEMTGAGARSTESKRAALKAAHAKLTWHARWQPGDAFDALLQELHTRLRFHRNSPYRFYAANEANG